MFWVLATFVMSSTNLCFHQRFNGMRLIRDLARSRLNIKQFSKWIQAEIVMLSDDSYAAEHSPEKEKRLKTKYCVT